MKIIAIDCSGLVASVAIVEDDNLIAEYNVQYKKTHSQTLLPMLDEIKRMTELDLSTVDAIALSKGPGSFTGLRIGSATAKGLSQALDIPIVEVGTLEGLSCNLYGTASLVCPIMDARRNQVYTGIFSYERKEDGFELVTHLKDCASGIEDLIDKVSDVSRETGKDVIFLGDGVPVFKEVIAERIGVPYSFAPAHMNRQRAASFAPLAMRYFEKGMAVSCFEHAPEYLRLSQAEREKYEGIANKGSNYKTDDGK
ncbi:MAG: tRNA (adenosine(37)-N6)-threonylcarbamoyltransferase complex dimerization subunit type 1 TsaB [Lachnospiraceae bacterium]|nr:tRNA (adenosine(37)-N6)-threonylcarbamoyltransferase complex dimerization subunit type 1 TsaB [Lachnospiraceae bacterium]